MLSTVILTTNVYEIVQTDDTAGKEDMRQADHGFLNNNTQMVYVFSLLFFGNLIDNLRHQQKTIIVLLEIAFATVTLIKGGLDKAFLEGVGL